MLEIWPHYDATTFNGIRIVFEPVQTRGRFVYGLVCIDLDCVMNAVVRTFLPTFILVYIFDCVGKPVVPNLFH